MSNANKTRKLINEKFGGNYLLWWIQNEAHKGWTDISLNHFFESLPTRGYEREMWFDEFGQFADKIDWEAMSKRQMDVGSCRDFDGDVVNITINDLYTHYKDELYPFKQNLVFKVKMNVGDLVEATEGMTPKDLVKLIRDLKAKKIKLYNLRKIGDMFDFNEAQKQYIWKLTNVWLSEKKFVSEDEYDPWNSQNKV